MLLIAVSLVPVFAQNEVSAVWTRLYKRATTLPQKEQILVNIVEQHSRDMIPVLQEALDERIRNLKNIQNTTEKELVLSVIKMVTQELGRLKATESAPYVWEVVQAVEDPIVKGEAIIALGKMGARQYAEELAMMLRNINFNYGDRQDQREDEIVAYALVLAQERLKHPAGYKPVFFASTGWYSGQSRVKEEASEALPVIVDDPSEQLMEILVDESDFQIKLQALRAELSSNAPQEKKAEVASLAFKESIGYAVQNKTERRDVKQLRIESLTAIQRLPDKNQEVLPFMEEMLLGYRKDRLYDEDEMLPLINALGSYKNDQAAKILSDFLAYLTERREGRPTDSMRIAKATIIALGNTENPIALEELNMVTISYFWENSVKRLAEEALQKIK